ncbi:hypothetical protein G5B35_10330 [Parapusillimonas sp. SGNA-6]|nr:hypothetical protein [Parapusillimonas sp. SGNA-6]
MSTSVAGQAFLLWPAKKRQGQPLALDALAASTDIRKSTVRSPGFNISNIDAAVLRRID